MTEKNFKSTAHHLRLYGIHAEKIHWNLSPEELEKIAIEKGQATRTSAGAITVDTGEFTGRSPKDRFIVKDEVTEDYVWWGDINIPFSSEDFDKLYTKVVAYLSDQEVYVRDAYACADRTYRMNLRVINEYAWSNQFSYNMFLRPSEAELQDFEPDWIIVNAPGFMADPAVDGTRQHNFAILNFSKRIALIGGTGYTGEIKKGIFSALNFILPHQRNTLSMHCSANVGADGDTALFFGLSGTGKTTLSADPNRRLIGDDEHGWSPENTIFNFEGGCYAKVIDLSEEKEPDIFKAIKPGAILENVRFHEGTLDVDFENTEVTENTRVSYPIEHIDNIQPGSMGSNPRNIFFLTCDAYGVLPPISRLTPGQAAFHFISGYTAKVAGTEAGITDPVKTFSACFGAPFMPLHPTQYASMLSQKMRENNVNVWLINTGWVAGGYGVGNRIKLKYTRAMITAALEGELENVAYHTHEVFGLNYPTTCPNVPNEVLDAREMWSDKSAYDVQSNKLAKSFSQNFKKFEDYADDEIIAGGPIVQKEKMLP
jgi:phosphoenolpyruvate carboxykinase (ATP)